MDKIEQAREVSSRIWNAGYVDESATIDALVAELERRNAALRLMTTKAEANWIGWKSAEKEIDRIKSQEPVAWMTQSGNPVLYKSAEQAVLYGWNPLFLAAGAQPVPSSKYPCQLTDAELADPEYMRSYIEAMNQDYADLLYAQLVQAQERKSLIKPDGQCEECLTYNGHQDGCSKLKDQS